MTEIRDVFNKDFNEPGLETSIDWTLPRREFAANVKGLFEELKKRGAAFPLPLSASSGSAASVLAGVDCRRCDGLCCNRPSTYISVFPSEAVRLGVKGTPDSKGQMQLPLPCKFVKKGQCSNYSDRPARCRFYPVQIGGAAGAQGNVTFIGLDSFCPESFRLGLRIYMASYDLAHGLKSL